MKINLFSYSEVVIIQALTSGIIWQKQLTMPQWIG